MVFFHFYSNSSRTLCDSDQTPRSVASDLGLCCLPMSHKKDARLIWVNFTTYLVAAELPLSLVIFFNCPKSYVHFGCSSNLYNIGHWL